jgi:hypothetical protein
VYERDDAEDVGLAMLLHHPLNLALSWYQGLKKYQIDFKISDKYNNVISKGELP